MIELKTAVQELTGMPPEIQMKVFLTLALILVISLLRTLILRLVISQTENSELRYHWRKTSSYIVAILYVLIVSRIWFDAFRSVATIIGLASAGLAIALRDPIVNLFGMFFILWRKPFKVGDRIEVDGNAGDVIDIRLFNFTILEIGQWVDADQSTGRVRMIPNGILFQRPLANYTKGFPYIWDELSVYLTFESDWAKAKELMQSIADDKGSEFVEQAQENLKMATREYLIIYRKLTPIVYTKVERDGVKLTIRYLTEARRRRGMKQVLWEAILTVFAQHDKIRFAYHTTRFVSDHSGQ